MSSVTDLIDRFRENSKRPDADRIADRLEFLRDVTLEEDTPFSAASIEGFLRFVDSGLMAGYPDIIVTYQGRIRARWRAEPIDFHVEFANNYGGIFLMYQRKNESTQESNKS